MYLILVFVIVITICALKSVEKFSDKNENELPNYIWMYWENKPNMTKYPYLDLCYKTILKNSPNFEIRLLDKKSVKKYIPDLRDDINKCMNIPQKTDYIRLKLLYMYGGIWIDSDTIMINDLMPLLKKLKKYDFIGFGCSGLYCNIKTTGKPYPSNWVMISQKNGLLMKKCIEEAEYIIDNHKYLFKKKYHIIGRQLLWKNIKKLMKTKKWDYLHVSSKCIERDSNGIKYKNNRLLSSEDYDKNCLDKIYFLPIYNTAPGFPKWFINLTEKEILRSNMLISKMFKLALNYQII